VWACGGGETDTQTSVTTIHFASSATHAKCNNNEYVAHDSFIFLHSSLRRIMNDNLSKLTSNDDLTVILIAGALCSNVSRIKCLLPFVSTADM